MIAGIAKFKIHMSEVIVTICKGFTSKISKIKIATDPFKAKSNKGKIGTIEVSKYIDAIQEIASKYVMSILKISIKK